MKIFNIIRNFFKILSLKPSEFATLISQLKTIHVMRDAIIEVSACQDNQAVIINQIAKNQMEMSTLQSRVVKKVYGENVDLEESDFNFDSNKIYLFYTDDDDDIIH
jgi:glyceraldehyde-3-phosphate dehydrogenase/erythrose-4-phosphate dehydrogenase|tara:strand:- start:45 stop:362 length:318 start_codon:yes stop_codon:yes gene_type:complete